MDARSAAASRLLESKAHGVIIVSETVEDCNEAACRVLGMPRSRLIGQSLVELSPAIQSDGTVSSERWQRRMHAASAGSPQWFQWQFRTDDAGTVHTLVHLSAESGDAGPCLIAQVHDLSRLSGAGWVLQESEGRLRNVLENTKAVIFVKDRAGHYIFVNHELERAVRRPAHEIIGRTDRELWRPEFAERLRRNDLKVIEQRQAIEFEVTDTFEDRQRTYLSFKFPLFDPDGTPYAVCGIATDISERKRIEDALRGSALAVSSAQGSTVFQELVRYLATTLKLDCALIAVPNDDDPRSMRVLAFFLDGEIRENFEYPIAGTPCQTVMGQAFRIYPSGLRAAFPRDPDFARLGFESYAGFPLTDSSGKPLGLVSVVSRKPMAEGEFVESVLKIFAVRAGAELERVRAEDALRASEASYRAIFEASEDAIFIHDWDSGAIVDVNPKACEAYGYTYDEMKRVTVADISSGEHPYTMEEAGKLIEQARSGMPLRFEWHRRNKDGSLHWDEVVLKKAVIAGKPRIVAFTREITERKLSEQALRQAQKMEAIGHLTGGIAHDFNNLLTSIMGYVVLATEREAGHGDPKLAKYLEQAHLSCVRARDLIQQMLTFSRGQRGEPRPLSLPPFVKESVKLLRSSLPATVEIDAELEQEVPAVLLDPVQLDQILLNLCINARDAMGGIGTIRVAVRETAPNTAVCASCRQSVAGTLVELCVADSGPGIAPEVLDRMFEPFFSTKEVGKGSGMGLSTVHGIVHEHGGHILVETGPGAGARFRVLFRPLQMERGAAVAPASAERRGAFPRHTLHGKVMVVDDEETVAEFMCDLLDSWGLKVTSVSSAAEARELFMRDPARFDLVITDQTMPRMTGLELAREMLALRADLPVILYTGLNDGIAQNEAAALGIRAFVTKPVEPQTLFGLLKTHLPGRAMGHF
jgi:PAS domain S-box-containing protein